MEQIVKLKDVKAYLKELSEHVDRDDCSGICGKIRFKFNLWPEATQRPFDKWIKSYRLRPDASCFPVEYVLEKAYPQYNNRARIAERLAGGSF